MGAFVIVVLALPNTEALQHSEKNIRGKAIEKKSENFDQRSLLSQLRHMRKQKDEINSNGVKSKSGPKKHDNSSSKHKKDTSPKTGSPNSNGVKSDKSETTDKGSSGINNEVKDPILPVVPKVRLEK